MPSHSALRRSLQRQIVLRGVGALVALCLWAGGARADDAWSRTFEAGIPLLGAAPQIDGQVQDAEWGLATRLPPLLSGDADGFIDELEANEIFIGYTAEALHIAWRVRREGEFVLRHLEPGYREGRAVWADDHIELFLDVGRADRRSITFVGNAAGAYGDGTIPFTGSG
ncbi:MAG: hypothetical protein K9N49_02140 [Candidatus Marinimicrobia bacterium]|nr:hypothetical protein [Candidatus Neomarinimicrobiota bacterium]